jgi:uncharacterized membrane protein YbhN (UPF0104 family)
MPDAATGHGAWQRGTFRVMASIAISAGLLAMTYVLMDQAGARASMLGQLARLDWRWLAAAVVAGLANNAVASLRFLVIIRASANVRLPFWTVQKVNAAALFLGYWTPVSIAGDGGRMIWLRKTIVGDYRRAFAIVLWDRVIALLALVAFMVPFLPRYVDRAADYFKLDGRAVAVATALVLALVVALVMQRALRARVGASRHSRALAVPVHVVLGALYVVTFFLVMLSAAAAVGLAVRWQDLFADAPLLFLAQNVPVTFGGLGSRELSFLVMLGPGVGDGSAVAMSLVVGLAFLLASLPGSLVLGELTAMSAARSQGA